MKKNIINKKNIVILGSTGTIGINTLNVIRESNFHKVSGLAAGNNIELLIKQVEEFNPDYVSVKEEKDAKILRDKFKNIKVLSSNEGLIELATLKEADLIVSAIVGFAGFIPTYYAVKNKKTVALANKESLVAGGFLFKRAELDKIIPIDSEHSAIFQILNKRDKRDIKKIILTASGGPFRDYSVEDMKKITKEEALNHPNWSMGDKITIDSSTMMNKTFEIIEAHYLFDLPCDKISVVVHPQSLVHSMVEFKDSSILAQMAYPDMKIPISRALYYPDIDDFPYNSVDFSKFLSLTFVPPDYDRFESLKFASTVISDKKKGVVLNQSNEVAVNSFLEGRISWFDILNVIKYVMSEFREFEIKNITDLAKINEEVKKFTVDFIDENF